MASLVDIARAMNKEKPSDEQKPPVVTVLAEPTAKPTTLTLVDIANEHQSATTSTSTKPLTLSDVARKADAVKDAGSTASAVSLQSLANEINAEERNRIDSAITKAATDVKQEKSQQRAEVLKAAATEVLRDERKASEYSRHTQPSETSPSEKVPGKASPPPVAKELENDGGKDDGYSSFEDDENESNTKKSPAEKSSTKKGHTTKRRPVENEQEDNQSDAGSAAGPEKTTPSDNPLAKEFLRAIYRGDMRRVRDMMREDESLDASTADQHGWSALHWAASQGQSEILNVLLDKNARVDAVELVNGWTALHLAVLRDAAACAKKLLHAGAVTTIRDLYGDSVHDLLRAVKGKKKERWLLLLDTSRHK